MTSPTTDAHKAAKPLPLITPLDRAYWDAARQHRYVLQRCSACAQYRFPASPVCPDCGATGHAWVEVSGRGTVLSWVVFHRCYFQSFAAEMPYNVAMIRLEEGPVTVSNVVGIGNADIRCGLPVEVVFEDVTDEISIPKFKPVADGR